ncbi:Putative assembly protein ORF301 [Habropoda laboriosa]|uniref:Putative assembly protein ORF301 n=1 Tax=Habropoda laboriosa TaxID=597456 RepID=A0A0L7QK21_9HYME|nr:Putative assembly protein ORF301 [Habropoda laboriosa]
METQVKKPSVASRVNRITTVVAVAVVPVFMSVAHAADDNTINVGSLSIGGLSTAAATVFAIKGLCRASRSLQFANVTHASTNVGGWNIGSAVAQGAATVFTAAKNGATAVAKLRPTPSQVASGLTRGLVGGLAMSIAQSLFNDGLDYVLDQGKQELRYNRVTGDFQFSDYPSVHGSSLSNACSNLVSFLEQQDSSRKWYIDIQNSSANNGVFVCRLNLGDPSNYWRFGGSIAGYNSQQKTVPFSQLASQVIDSADNGNKDAQALTTAVAQTATATNTDDQIVPASQLSQALDAVSPSQSNDDVKSPTTNPTNSNTQTQDQTQDQTASSPVSTPTASPMPSDIPKDCAFFNTACVWFDWTKKQYTDVKTVVTDYFKDPDQTDKDTNVDDDAQAPTLKTDYIKFSETCPFSPKKDSITIGDQTTEIESDFSDACSVQTALKGAGLGIGTSTALLTAMNSYISSIVNTANSMGGNVVGLCGLAGAHIAISSIIGACVYRMTLIKERDKDLSRPIYTDITGIKWNAVGDAPEDWRDAPDNSLIVYDEIQFKDNFSKAYSSKRDKEIIELSTMRKRGIEIWLITQRASYLNANVIGLINQHVHFEKRSQTSSYAYIWQEAQTNITKIKKQLAFEKFVYTYNEDLYDFYDSIKTTAKHNKGRSYLDKRIVSVVLTLLFALIAGTYYIKSSGVTNVNVPVVDNQPLDIKCRQASNLNSKECIDFMNKLTKDKGSLDTVVYDPTKPYDMPSDVHYTVVNQPKFSGCMGTRKGGYKAYTEQGTILKVDKSVCDRLMSDSGDRPYDYFGNRKPVEQPKQDNNNNLKSVNIVLPDSAKSSHMTDQEVKSNMISKDKNDDFKSNQ